MATEPEQAAKPVRQRKAATVTATTLAQHLGLSRQRIMGLAEEQVIVRQDDGRFDQDAARLSYLDWLRDPARRSARSEAESAFVTAKTRLLEIRTQERLGQLVPVEVMTDSIDIIVALYRTELAGLPASFTRDIAERRRLDRLVHELLKRVANEAGRRASNVAASEGNGRSEAFALEPTDDDD